MKKCIIAFCAVICSFMFGNALASETDDFEVENGMITAYIGNESIVTVPSVIDGREIAGIDSYAFKNNDKVRNVVIDDGIEVIQSYAFYNCSNLKSIKCPDSVLLINLDAFYKCNSLSDVEVSSETVLLNASPIMTLDDNSDISGDFTFSDGTITKYNGTSSTVVIPETINGITVKAIGAGAFAAIEEDGTFSENTLITSVIIPDTVTSIGNQAFYKCTSLTDVNLPSGLTSVGTEVFAECTALTEITVPGTLKRIGKNMFNGCTGLKKAVLQEGVTYTGNWGFNNCTNLETIEIPSTLTGIGVWSFGYCKKLNNIYLPTGVTSIDSAAFYYCNSINSIVMPDTVKTIGTHCFRECQSLNSITLSGALTTIPLRAFHNCTFSKIDIPKNVTTIAKESFYQCAKLENITFPENVAVVGENAFYSCTQLGDIVVYGKNIDIAADAFVSSKGGNLDGIQMFVAEGSEGENFAKNNNIAYKQFIKADTAVAEGSDVGIICEVSFSANQKPVSFGTKYIPDSLYTDEQAEILDIGYDASINEIMSGQTFETLMTDIPQEAKQWYFIGTPYITFENETTVEGTPRRFSLYSNIKNITGGN